MPQLRENYQPSANGKVSSGLAAGIVGVGAYAYKYNLPKPAQQSVKVPSSPNVPPRGAAASATSATSWYSTRAKASVGIKNLENSYRMKGATWRGGGGSAIASAVIGYVGGEILQPLVIPPLLKAGTRWSRQLGGITSREAAMLTAAIDSGKVRNISEAVGFIERTRGYQKQEGILHVPDSPQSLNPLPFKGGQTYGRNYTIAYEAKYSNFLLRSGSGLNYDVKPGKIVGIIKTTEATPQSQSPHYYTFLLRTQNASGAIFDEFKLGTAEAGTYFKIISVVATDGLPDTGGDPVPEGGISNSGQGTLSVNPDDKKIAVGEVPSPPPALISRSGDFLYDGARAPLQRVLDGTAPPWARAENPVARMPGTRILPATPTVPADIPQPDVAPSPAPDDTPNPYPFFDPVTFPDTVAPNQFDIKPAFTPNPLVSNPLSPNPLTPTTSTPATTPTKFPSSVPSTGTPLSPNPTTRNPEPVPKTTTPVKSEPAPEKSPTERVLEQLPGIATGIAILTPIVRGIQTQTSPEAIVPLVKEGTCQSLNGGCTNGVNIPNQLASNSNKLDAIQLGLQGLDLNLLNTIDQKLGAQIPGGGIGGKLSRFINFAVADRVMNLATFMVTVHNAMMLSNNIGATLFSILDNIGNTGNLILHPDGDSNINSSEWISSNLDSLFSTWIGETQWTNIKKAYKTANNIFSTYSNMYDNLRSIHNDSQELLNMVRKDTAELGNALVEEGVISEDNWDVRDPNIKIKSKSLARLQRMNEGLEALDNKLEAIEQLTSTLLNIAQTAKEVKDNVSELTTQLSGANETFKTARTAAIDALPDFNFDIDDLF